ncbi:DUF7341 domain-containing protein [Glutamicibacter sp. X7]
MSTLRMLAQQLTETHLTRHGDRIGKVPPLLTELREAVSGSTHEGGGSGAKQRILVNSEALDLLRDIEKEVSERYKERYETNGHIRPDDSIKIIGQDQHDPDWDEYLTYWLQDWAKRIEDLVRPRKVRRLDGTPCPSCEQAVYGEDRETCLAVDCYTGPDKQLRPVSEWTVECHGCGATWQGRNMQWLLAALSSPVID